MQPSVNLLPGPVCSNALFTLVLITDLGMGDIKVAFCAFDLIQNKSSD